jgi:hypothetical protein
MSYGQALIALVAIWEIIVLGIAIVARIFRNRIAKSVAKAAKWFRIPHIMLAVIALSYWFFQTGTGGNSQAEAIVIGIEALVWVGEVFVIEYMASENHPKEA